MAVNPEKIEEETEEIKFNMSNLFYLRIHKIIMVADECSFNWNMEGWYISLKSLFRNISPIVSKKNDKICEGIDKDFNKIHNFIYDVKLLSPDKSYSDMIRQQNHSQAYNLLDKIHTQIIRMMHQKGLLLPKGKLRGLKKFEESLGIIA